MKKFFQAVAEPVSIAFATASSEVGVASRHGSHGSIRRTRQIVAFVLPTGYSFNLDGSSLYLSLASIFVAQVAGIHMTLWASSWS